jgi:uncharacterized protein (DUF1499 family)
MKWLVLILLLPVLLLVGALMLNRPPLFDPPGPLVRLKTYLTTNVAETRPDHSQPELQTPVYPFDARAARSAVLAAMDGLGWREVRVVAPDEIRAVVVTPLLGFRDDVTVRLAPDVGGRGTRIAARSASRVGRGDMAANERHLLDLFAVLNKATVGGRP